jgi:hypothetical protein
VEIKGLFNDIQRVSMKEFKLIALGKWVKSYGVSNPHAIAGWDRDVSEWEAVQKDINAFVSTKGDGWAYLTTTHLQEPLSKKEMSDVLEDILANADAIKEPAFKAIKEQYRRERIREDATHARNRIKDVKAFFQKYGVEIPNALTLLGGIINDVESQVLA